MALRPLGKLDCTEPIGQIRLYTGEGTPTPVLPRWARWIFERGAKGGRFAATAQKFEITGGFRGGGGMAAYAGGGACSEFYTIHLAF